MLKEHLIIAVGWTFFCVLHSVLAASGLKKNLSRSKPKLFTYYRLFYTLFAFFSMAAVLLYQFSITSPLLFKNNGIVETIGWSLAAAGGLLMLICIKKYFLSLSGLKSFFAHQIVANNLRIDGVHRFVRHPLYLGTFLFIWGAWLIYPGLSFLIANVIITVYTLIGTLLEEKKLVEEFGTDYQEYMKKVPRILPFRKMA